MGARWRVATSVRVVSIGCVAAVLACSGGTGAAAAGGTGGRWSGHGVAGRAVTTRLAGDILTAVAATSARNAWAVGGTGSNFPLILRWNGATWTRAVIPTPPDGLLNAVAAGSADNAWAVGRDESGTLTLRWDGVSWTHVPSPDPATGSPVLSGVAMAGTSDAWAVGNTTTAGEPKILIMGWDGASWTQASGPNISRSQLTAVAATSATNAWAVGDATGRPLILRWNGARWARVAVPALTGSLFGVTATSADNAWAAGVTFHPHDARCPYGCTLILHWNGRSWRQQASPSPPSGPSGDWLFAVTALGAHDAWATGGTNITNSDSGTLILHWNGRAWRRVPCPSPAGGPNLLGVAVTSARNAWAVGYLTSGSPFAPVIVRWTGASWHRVL